MTKSANLYARIEPNVKDRAEAILDALGITASNAITIFYKQIILQDGLPFEVKLPKHSANMNHMTQEELNNHLKNGYINMKTGHTHSAEEAFDDIHREYGI